MFLDDIRVPIENYDIVVRSYDEAIELVKQNGIPTFISFDHDLGCDEIGNILKSGYDFAKWLVDDFGTGYSSMSYLKKLPITRLKIDKSFVDDLPFSQESVAIAKAIISLAKSFGITITAEGVENREQLEFLINENCDEIQGYYFSKPITLEELKVYE